MRVNSFADNAAAELRATARSAPSRSSWTRPARRCRLQRAVERFPYVPADPARLEQDCYEAYNIQVEGLATRLKATGSKTLVIGVSGGLDSTHALIVCARALDKLGRPRSDIMAYTLPGFATSEGTKANAMALMEAIGATPGEIDIRPAARQMLADIGHPFAQWRAGLRRDVRERAGGPSHRLPVPPRQPPPGHRGRHRRPLRAGAGLVHLRRRRPDEPLQRQFVGAEDADPAPDPLRGGERRRDRGDRRAAARHPRHRDLARAGAGRRRRARSSPPRPSSAPTRCRTSTSTTRRATASRRPRSPTSPSTPGPTPAPASGRATSPRRRGAPTTSPKSATGWRCSCSASSRFSQFKRSAMPNGPKISSGGSLSPRGDWRAPSDGNATAWLAELAENVPEGAGKPG